MALGILIDLDDTLIDDTFAMRQAARSFRETTLQGQRRARIRGLLSRDVADPKDTGKPKPDPSIFLAAVALLGLEPADCLMIGDNHEVDIAPAQLLGMAAFHVSLHEPGRRLVDALP